MLAVFITSVVIISILAITVKVVSSAPKLKPKHEKKKEEVEENFCVTTGYTYEQGGANIPDLSKISREPPFYDLTAARPAECSYRNYTYPVPMGFSPLQPSSPCGKEEGKKLASRYLYWYSDAMLSHPQTPFLV